jgi:hypothetical protein
MGTLEKKQHLDNALQNAGFDACRQSQPFGYTFFKGIKKIIL